MKNGFPHWEQNLGIAVVVIWCLVLSICLLYHNDEPRKPEKPETIIGESWTQGYFYGYENWYWNKFTQKDIQDEVDGYIKINGYWVEKDYVFYYSDIDIYEPIRKKIYEKYEPKEVIK